LSAAFRLLTCSCDVKMFALVSASSLNAIGTLGTRVTSRRSFDAVYVQIPSVADEADGSGPQD
jgi:hypothetical protein